jgi:hypothetical protein
LEYEPDQDEMNAMEEVAERIQDSDNQFDQRQSESMEIDIVKTGTEGQDEAQAGIRAKEEVKDVSV